MKPWGLMFFAVVLAIASWSMSAQEKKAETKNTEAQPIRQLSWLEGGVWVADASKLAPGMQRIETR